MIQELDVLLRESCSRLADIARQEQEARAAYDEREAQLCVIKQTLERMWHNQLRQLGNVVALLWNARHPDAQVDSGGPVYAPAPGVGLFYENSHSFCYGKSTEQNLSVRGSVCYGEDRYQKLPLYANNMILTVYCDGRWSVGAQHTVTTLSEFVRWAENKLSGKGN